MQLQASSSQPPLGMCFSGMSVSRWQWQYCAIRLCSRLCALTGH